MTKTTLFFLGIFLGVFIVDSAFAVNNFALWTKLGTNDNKTATSYLDSNSVKIVESSAKEQVIQYTTKLVYQSAQSSGNLLFNEAVLQWQGDCLNYKIHPISASIYGKNGELLATESNKNQQWLKPPSESIGESEVHSACYLAGYRSQP